MKILGNILKYLFLFAVLWGGVFLGIYVYIFLCDFGLELLNIDDHNNQIKLNIITINFLFIFLYYIFFYNHNREQLNRRIYHLCKDTIQFTKIEEKYLELEKSRKNKEKIMHITFECILTLIIKRDYRKFIKYHKNFGTEITLNFNYNYCKEYFLFLGIAYQEVGYFKKAKEFFDCYLEYIAPSEFENEKNLRPELQKIVFLVNTLDSLNYSLKVDKRTFLSRKEGKIRT